MWDDPGPVDVPRIDPLLDALASAEPAPGSGSAAALAGAMAAAVCAKAARLSGDGGATAQAAALCRRLTALAEADARVYRTALAELERRDDDAKLGRALERAADLPLQIAEVCADVVELAAGITHSAPPELQADTRAAAAIAAGATRAAATLVEVNLTVTEDDGRARLARKLCDQVQDAVRT